MELRDTAQESDFRQDVRQFISANLPPGFGRPDYIERYEGPKDKEPGFMSSWRAALSTRNWIAPHWPSEYGGAGLTTIEQFIFNEEMASHRAPPLRGHVGVRMIGPTLILYGNDEQKKRFLPEIANDEVVWCQGYSEPGAGSDLASLKTRAVREGDSYVVDGHKIWTTNAHNADWMFMLCRTDPEAPKHRGISMLLLDMKSPGLTISPLVNLAGDHSFNQVFFDNVRVPVEQRVGEENRGWYYGATLLDFERSNIGGSINLANSVEDLIQFAKEHSVSDGAPIYGREQVKVELTDRWTEATISRLLAYRIVSIQRKGQVPNYEASVSKMFLADAGQRLARTGMRLIGTYGTLSRLESKWAPLRGQISHRYLSSVAGTIAGGTSEIQRNVIAHRGLGLPRD